MALKEAEAELERLTSRVTDLQDELHLSTAARAQIATRNQEYIERTNELVIVA
jgi:hypothetical protein